MTLTRSWVTIAALPPGIAVGFALFDAVGRLSGYRPFRKEWKDLSLSEAEELSGSLRRAAKQMGFELAWVDCDDIDFVSVRNIEMETTWPGIRGGKQFPMRLSCFKSAIRPGQFDLQMKLANRTVVVWDSGERQTCNATAQKIVDIASGDAPRVMPEKGRAHWPASLADKTH